MKYDMVRPCENCPFLKTGGVRLRKGRIHEIAQSALDMNFLCHKTAQGDETDDGDYCATGAEQHCVGSEIFALKQGAVMDRRGLEPLDKTALPRVFESLRQMLRTAIR